MGEDGLRPHPQRRHPARDCATACRCQAQIANTPVNSDHRLETWGAFVQDRWALGRATINLGVRFDGVERLPARRSRARRARTSASARSPSRDVFDFRFNVAPRLGLSYDLFGNGRTALKAYYGRFYNQFGSEIAETVNPNAWRSERHVERPQQQPAARPRRARRVHGFPRGLFPRVDEDAKPAVQRRDQRRRRPPADAELRGGGQLSPPPASRRPRRHRSRAAASAYTPVVRTYTDPERGRSRSRSSASTRAGARAIASSPMRTCLESDYDGVQFDSRSACRTMAAAGGPDAAEHEGFSHSGTYTNPVHNRFNDPNYLLNRDDGSVFIDLPWAFSCRAATAAVRDRVSGKYTARAGDPLNRTQS